MKIPARMFNGIALSAFLLWVAWFFGGIPVVPGAKDPVQAYQNGTLIDCRDRKTIFIVEPHDIAVLLDAHDAALVMRTVPMFAVADENAEQEHAVLFIRHLAGGERPAHRYTHIQLYREADGGYCAKYSTHTPYEFDELLQQKYKHS
jgi:hypothetical protein